MFMSSKLHLKFSQIDTPKQQSFGMLTWLRRVWLLGTLFAIMYFLLVYILPIYRVISIPIIPFKTSIEMLICLIPIITGFGVSNQQIRQDVFTVAIDNEILLLNSKKQTTGLCCLEIVSVSGSVFSDENGRPQYNTSMLLAIRAGMSRSVTMAFEAGVLSGEPFLRIFITTTDYKVDVAREVLRREATRVEAILLASFNLVDIRLLEQKELQDAVASFVNCFDSEDRKMVGDDTEKTLLIVLKGSPRVTPSLDSSQIGTFLSTVLKQNYSASMTCVFSIFNVSYSYMER